MFLWWRWKDLNFRPSDYDSAALTTELHRRYDRGERTRNAVAASGRAGHSRGGKETFQGHAQ